MILLEIFFFILCFIVINMVAIYPIVVYLINRNKALWKRTDNYQPSVSILFAARNEEKVIEERIKNLASQNYDFNKVEVYVGSDASEDATNEILLRLQNDFSWLKIFISDRRIGKAGILNELIEKVNNDILLFTDANTIFEKDALKNLVQDFYDEKVGGVCGRLVLIDDEKVRSRGVEELNYWQYETFIKRGEGRNGILLAANGGIFAIRKNLYKQIPTEKAVTDDLFISLSVIEQGYRFTYCEEAVAYENTGKDIKSEYKRKVRFSATNFQTLADFKNLLTGKNRLLAYAFFSHKVTRWFLPMLLFLILILSGLLAKENSIILAAYILQLLFYLSAFGGFLFSLVRIRISVFSLPYFFVISNIAVAAGFIRFLKKKHSVIWESTER